MDYFNFQNFLFYKNNINKNDIKSPIENAEKNMTDSTNKNFSNNINKNLNNQQELIKFLVYCDNYKYNKYNNLYFSKLLKEKNYNRFFKSKFPFCNERNDENSKKIKLSRKIKKKNSENCKKILIGIKNKLKKNKIIYNELLNIQNIQILTSEKIHSLINLFQENSQISEFSEFVPPKNLNNENYLHKKKKLEIQNFSMQLNTNNNNILPSTIENIELKKSPSKKNEIFVEKQDSKPSISLNNQNNSNIFDYFSFRIKNSTKDYNFTNNSNTSIPNVSNPNNFHNLNNSNISNTEKTSKKQNKFNETFYNYRIKSENSFVKDNLLESLELNRKKSHHSPDRLYNNKFFEDSDSFKYNNTLNKNNITNPNFMASSNSATNKFFELTSNPFNLKDENNNINNSDTNNIDKKTLRRFKLSSMDGLGFSNNENLKFSEVGKNNFDLTYEEILKNKFIYFNENEISQDNQYNDISMRFENVNNEIYSNNSDSGMNNNLEKNKVLGIKENSIEKNVNFEKMKVNSDVDNIVLNINKEIKKINSENNIEVNILDNIKKNQGNLEEFKFIKKNLENNRITENSLIKDDLSLMNFSAVETIEKKENNENLDNSIGNSANDNLISAKKSNNEKSIISGSSDAFNDLISQTSSKYLVDSKVRGFNFKNNINTRKFNKPLISNSQNNLSNQVLYKQNSIKNKEGVLSKVGNEGDYKINSNNNLVEKSRENIEIKLNSSMTCGSGNKINNTSFKEKEEEENENDKEINLKNNIVSNFNINNFKKLNK